MNYPRAVKTIKQIEITTRCNLKCPYCPSPTMARKKEDMSLPVYLRALEWVKHYRDAGTQGELSLTGIGESLLHPCFVDMVAMAREVLPDQALVIATNGLLLTEELCRKLKPYEPRLFISLHRPEKAGPAIEAAKKYGLFAGTNVAFVTSSLDWAGQVDWYVSAPPMVCEFLRSGWGVVMVDGNITTCCLDSTGSGIVGSVMDSIGPIYMKPYDLCNKCHMTVP